MPLPHPPVPTSPPPHTNSRKHWSAQPSTEAYCPNSPHTPPPSMARNYPHKLNAPAPPHRSPPNPPESIGPRNHLRKLLPYPTPHPTRPPWYATIHISLMPLLHPPPHPNPRKHWSAQPSTEAYCPNTPHTPPAQLNAPAPPPTPPPNPPESISPRNHLRKLTAPPHPPSMVRNYPHKLNAPAPPPHLPPTPP